MKGERERETSFLMLEIREKKRWVKWVGGVV